MPSSAPAASDQPSGETAYNISGLGLPVIQDGRLRNYVFVSLRLYLGSGLTPEGMRAKEPYFRDALIRATHRRSYALPGDWMRLDERQLTAAMVAMGRVLTGRGSVVRAEVVSQTPRRQIVPPTAA